MSVYNIGVADCIKKQSEKETVKRFAKQP